MPLALDDGEGAAEDELVDDEPELDAEDEGAEVALLDGAEPEGEGPALDELVAGAEPPGAGCDDDSGQSVV